MGEARNVVGRPVEHEHYDVFISYRRSTGLDIARSIAYWFRLKKFKCFLDQTELLSGQFNEQIYSAIENTRYFILLMPDGALERCANDDDWVRREIEYAIEKRGRDCIIPITPSAQPSPLPGNLPESMAFLRTCEVSTIDRLKNFDSTLRTVVEHRMPVLFNEIRKRNLLSENEMQLIGTIRWFKRNDGVIDGEEMKKINDAANEYNISSTRLQALITQVEAESAAEQDATMRSLIESCMADDGKISHDERDAIHKKARELQVPETRLTKIMAEIEGQKKNNAKANESVRRIRRLKKWLGSVAVFLVVAMGACAFLYLNGINISDEQMRARFNDEKANITAEAQRKIQSADKARESAEKARLAADKNAAVLSLAREQAEKDAKDAQAKLAAALDSAAAAENARKDVESQLAQAKTALEAEQSERAQNKAMIEGRRKELLDKLAKEQSARKDAEVRFAEKASELEAANGKIQSLEKELETLRKDMDAIRHQRQLDALRDI